MLRTGRGLVVKRGGTEVVLPSDLTGGVRDDAVRVSADGLLVGTFDASTSLPTLTIYDVVEKKVRAKRAPSKEIVGGTVDAQLGTGASVVWTFSRANCELQDVDSGKPKCGTCDNSSYASFMKGQGQPVKATVENKIGCVK